MKTIATLLTVHNRKDKTIECLSHLFRQEISDGYSLDVYLTDDECTDGTVEAVKLQFPQVNIITGDGNLYWNRGMFKAWDTASKKKDYDYYLWLNDDTNLYPSALECLICYSIKYKNLAIIVGVTQNTSHTRLTYGGRIRNSIPPPMGEPVEVDFFNGNIVLIPKYVFDRVGNLDCYFTHSKGDFDYGLRARKEGIHIIQVGDVLGECDRHSTVDKWCNPDVPFKERWKAMWRPNGMPPHETFHLEARHQGKVVACIHFFTIIFRCLMPKLWQNKK